MNNLLDTLGNLALNYPQWTTLIIAIGIAVQGEVTTLVSLYLVVGKHITLLQFLIPALIGLFVWETLLYMLGRNIRGTRFGWKLYRRMKDNRKIQLYTYYLKNHSGKFLLAAKFIPGMNSLMLFLMGWTKTGFSKFLRIYIPATLFWLTVATTSAYAVTSGLHYLRSAKIFKDIEFIIIGIVLLLFLGEHFAKKLLQMKAPKNLPELEGEK